MPIYRASGKLIFSMAFQLLDHAYSFILLIFYLVVSNADRWDLRRWSVDKLKDELNRRNICFDTILGRNELVNLLKQEMGEAAQIGKESREDFSKMDIDE